MRLTLDGEDAPETSRIESVQAVFVSCVGGPSFTAMEQLTENACLLHVHFGSFSQVFVSRGSLGQFRHGAGGSSGDF